MALLQEKIVKAIEGGVSTVGATAEIKFIKELPAAELDEDMTNLLAETITDVMGKDALLAPFKTAGGEDFFFYTRHKPSIKAGFFGLGVNATPGLHHPDMHFDTDALETGVTIFKTAVKKILG